jgi:hypothetical protein
MAGGVPVDQETIIAAGHRARRRQRCIHRAAPRVPVPGAGVYLTGFTA